jgi:hypothetical protein
LLKEKSQRDGPPKRVAADRRSATRQAEDGEELFAKVDDI